MKKLTEKQQLAVAVAKDILERLDDLRLNNSGEYVKGRLPKQINCTDQVRKHLRTLRKHCNVCANGAMFLSYIWLKNEVAFDESIRPDDPWENGKGCKVFFWHADIEKKLLEAFSQQTIYLVETAFERYTFHRSTQAGISKELLDKAIDFGNKYDSPSSRMRAICRNLIKNKGEFVP